MQWIIRRVISANRENIIPVGHNPCTSAGSLPGLRAGRARRIPMAWRRPAIQFCSLEPIAGGCVLLGDAVNGDHDAVVVFDLHAPGVVIVFSGYSFHRNSLLPLTA